MTGYTQLTHVERYQNQALKRHSFKLTAFAAELERHKSTINRELRRNSHVGSYRAEQAQRSALRRRHDRWRHH